VGFVPFGERLQSVLTNRQQCHPPSLHSDTSRPFPKPKSSRIAVKVINHLGDDVMKVFKVE